MHDNDASLWLLRTIFVAGEKWDRTQQLREASRKDLADDDLIKVSRNSFPCALPDTLLYESGVPKRFMRADIDSGKGEFRTLAMDDPKILLDIVLKMSTAYHSCLLWYSSGSCEELPVTRLFEVFSSLEWQQQIVCVQGYQGKSKLVPLDFPHFSLSSDSNLIAMLDRLVVFLNTWSPQHTIKHLIARFALPTLGHKTPISNGGSPRRRRGPLSKTLNEEPSLELPTLCFAERVTFGKCIRSVAIASTPPRSESEGDETRRHASTNEPASLNHGLDLNFEDYVESFSATQRELASLVVVNDCFEPISELHQFAASCAKDGLRVILVNLYKDTRPAALPASNVLLSNWLHRLIEHLEIGAGAVKARPWILMGIGVGANVAMHMAAYRKCPMLQAIISVNGFSYVDRPMLRAISSISETLHPEASRILSHMRNEFLDLRSGLPLIKTPMVVVQGTQSRHVLSMHVEAILNARGAPKTVSNTLRDCIRHQDQVRNHVMWLKADHNIWASRTEFMENLVHQLYALIRALNNIQLMSEKSTLGNTEESTPETDVFDPQSEGPGQEAGNGDKETKEADDRHSPKKSGRSLRNLKSGRKSKSRKFGQIKEQNGTSDSDSDPGDAEDDDSSKSKRKQTRSRDVIEQERTEREELRRREEQRLRMELFWKNRPTEAEERSMMMDADSFSKDLRRTYNEELRWQKQQALVKERIEELHRAREVDKAREQEHAKKRKQREEANDYLTQITLMDDDAAAALGGLQDDLHTVTVLGSSVSGASKIRLDFIKIAQRQAINIERSQSSLELIRGTQGRRDAAMKRVAELERAISMLRASANVQMRGQVSRQRMRGAEQAKEELGDMLQSHKESQSLVQGLNLQLKDLQADIGKINSSIQTDSIILQRRGAEMDDMIERLSNHLEELERETEKLMAKRKATVQQLQSVTRMHTVANSRFEAIKEELDRCGNLRTKFCDSSIWQAGVMQRIRTSDLINYLSSERVNFASRLEYMQEEIQTQEDMIQRIDSRLAQMQKDKSNLLAQRKLISGALDLYRSGEIKRKAMADFKQQQENDGETTNNSDIVQGKLERTNSTTTTAANSLAQTSTSLSAWTRRSSVQDLASEVRRKPSAARNQEEREWIALDMAINRFGDLYTPEQVHNYRHYRPTELTDEVIDVLYELPEELNLALPFIRSLAQMRAYKLIQRYSFGNDPEDLVRLDRFEAKQRRKGNKIYRVFNSSEHYRLTLQEEDRLESDDDKSSVLLRDEWMQLYHIENQSLEFRQGRVHSFFIMHNVAVLQLVVHIVYKGGFDERGYVNGRLSAAMYLNETTPIGYCSLNHEVSLNSSDALGRFTLIHDPEEAGIPLSHGRYQIVVGAASLTQYSITIMAETCRPIQSVESDAKGEAVEMFDRVKAIDDDIEHLTVSLYLSERKFSLVKALVQDAEVRCENLEIEMATVNRVIQRRRERIEMGGAFTAADDEDDLGVDEATAKKYNSKYLAKLEREFNKWVQLAASRRMELVDCRKGTADMANMKRELREEKKAKQDRLAALKRTGIVSDEEIEAVIQAREASMADAANQDRLRVEQEIENILAEQSHADACWSDAYQVFHPESVVRAGGADPAMQKSPETCSREELMALMFARTEVLEGPKAIILHHLLRERAHPLERRCIQEPMLQEPRMKRQERLNFVVKATEQVTDIDRRCRLVLAELERANASSEDFVDSSILHSSEQRFPIKILRKELNRELDRLLLLQVKEQETFILKDIRRKERDSYILAQVKNSDDLDGLMSSSDEEDEEDEGDGTGKKANGEDENAESEDDEDPGGTAARINAALEKAQAERAHCQACNTSPCEYTPPVDLVELEERMSELRKELETARRIDETVKFVDSQVPKSVKQGGKSRMLRTDLIRELVAEITSLERKARLVIVDEELHLAYASKSPFMETKALHGYKQVQWTQNVIIALEGERARLLGAEVVEELLDGVLDFMLEGWIFGERETENFVLSSKSGDNGEGNDTKEDRIAPADKWTSISRDIARRQRRQKAVDLKDDVKHQLDETENVLRFGIFTMTLMYFRAMTLLRKSRFESRQGPGGHRRRQGSAIGVDAAAVAAERQRMQSTAARVNGRKRAMDFALGKAAAGAKTRYERVEKKLNEDKEKLRKRVQRARREATAAVKIQSVVRGHLGRRAAVVWAATRLELIAYENLRRAAAIALQRVFRGFQARKIAEDRRLELAEFIAAIRAAEAKEEEEEFFRHNPFQRIIYNARRILRATKSPKPDPVDEFFDPEPPANF